MIRELLHLLEESPRCSINFRVSNAAPVKKKKKKTGERKGEVGLVLLDNFTALITEQHIARILNRELNGRVLKYNHSEPKNIVFDVDESLQLL